MTSSTTGCDYAAELLEKLVSGEHPTPTLTQHAIKYYKTFTERFRTFQAVVVTTTSKDLKANSDIDFVNDVLWKLNTGRHPPSTIAEKAVKYYEAKCKKMKAYEVALTEKRLAETGNLYEYGKDMNSSKTVVTKENGEDTSKTKLENMMKLSLVSLSAIGLQEERPVQENPENHELYKVMAANAKHTVEIKSLKEDLETANSEVEKLLGQIQEQTYNDDLCRQNKQLKTKLDEIKEENRKFSSENEILNQKFKSARDETDEMCKLNKQLKTKLDVLEEEIRKLRSENEILNLKLNSARAETNEKSEKANDIGMDLENVTNTSKRINTENLELKKELVSVKEKVDRQSKEITKLTHTADRITEDDSVRRELQTLNDSYATLKNENTALKQNLHFAQQEIEKQSKKLSAHNEERPGQMDTDKHELYKVMAANAKHTSEIKKLKEDVETATVVVERLSGQIQEQADNDGIHLQNKQLKTKLNVLERENRQLSSECEFLNQKLNSTEDELDEKLEKVYKIRKDFENVTDTNKRLSSENWDMKKEVDSVKEKLKRQSKEVMKLTQNADRIAEDDSAKRDLQTLKGSYSTLENENMALKQKLQSAQQEIETQYKHFSANNNSKEGEMRFLKRDVETLKEVNRRLESDNGGLKRDLSSSEKNVKLQSKQIKELSEYRNREDTYVAVLKKELENLKEANSRINVENANMKRELKSAKYDIQIQLKQIKDLSTKVDNIKQDDSAQKVIQRLTEENERLGSEITKIMRQVKAGENETEEKAKDQEDDTKKGMNSRSKTEHSRMLDKQKDLNQKLSDENKKLEEEVNDLKNRLSALASHKMLADNPNIADLSDLYRPTNLAEQFRQVYDEEWTDAYEELEKENSEDEFKSIDALVTILKNIETFCVDVSLQQFDSLKSAISNEFTYPKYQHKSGTVIAGRHRAEMSVTQTNLTDKLLKDLRKSLGILSTGPLAQIFQQVQQTEYGNQDGVVSSRLNSFLVQAIKLVWMMKMQAPPMAFIWAEANQIVDKTRFTFYTKRGEIIKQCVWPAVVLHEKGPVMSKGIIQAV